MYIECDAACVRPFCCCSPAARAQDKAHDKTEKLAPYYPTPETIVEKMLQLRRTQAGEKMFDLGSGDGRIVIMAAQKFKADATGVEFDDALYKQSMEKIKTLGLAATARIIHGDLLKQDYSSADLLDRLSAADVERQSDARFSKSSSRRAPALSRTISNFRPGRPMKIQDIDDDGEGRSHRLYLVPALDDGAIPGAAGPPHRTHGAGASRVWPGTRCVAGERFTSLLARAGRLPGLRHRRAVRVALRFARARRESH